MSGKRKWNHSPFFSALSSAFLSLLLLCESSHLFSIKELEEVRRTGRRHFAGSLDQEADWHVTLGGSSKHPSMA
jgi:hypothetical protein